jgi:hypothetical protein
MRSPQARFFSVLVLSVLVFTLLLLPSVHAVEVEVVNQPGFAQITVIYTDAVQMRSAQLEFPNDRGLPTSVGLCRLGDTAGFSKEIVYRSCTNGQPQSLEAGTYLLKLEATDDKGRDLRDYPAFRILGIEIIRESPRCLATAKNEMTIAFSTIREEDNGTITAVPTYCSYRKGTDAPFFREEAKESAHTIKLNVPSQGFPLRVECAETKSGTSLIGQKATASWDLLFDPTPPTITDTRFIPTKLTDRDDPSAALHFSTSDPVACRIRQAPTSAAPDPVWRPASLGSIACGEYGGVEAPYQLLLPVTDEFDPTILEERTYTYELNCTNLAGLSIKKTLAYTSNLGQDLVIRKITPDDALKTAGTAELIVKPLLVDTSLAPIGACYLNPPNVACGALTNPLADTIDPTQPPVPGEHLNAFSATVNLIQGKNLLRVRCCIETPEGTIDESANFTVTVDSIPPGPVAIKTTTGVCDGQINATFIAKDKDIANYTYVVTYGGEEIALDTIPATATHVSVRIPIIDERELVWSVYATDIAGNDGPENSTEPARLHAGEEEECTGVPFIILESPKPLGYATKSPYTFSVRARRPAVCKYGSTPENLVIFPQKDGLVFSAPDLTAPTKTFYVQCDEDGRIHRKRFDIGYLTASPSIGISGKSTLHDRLNAQTVLTVTTDQSTACTIAGRGNPEGSPFDNEQGDPSSLASYGTTHIKTLDFSDITTNTLQEFMYTITCQNLAGKKSTAKKTITVHFGASMTFTVISPGSYVGTPDVELAIEPDRAASCTWRNSTAPVSDASPFTVSEGIHRTAFTDLEDGQHEYAVFCRSDDGTREAGGTVSFTVDTTTPSMTLSGPSAVCIGTPAQFRIEASTLDPEPIIGYDVQPLKASFNGTLPVIVIPTDDMVEGSGSVTATLYTRGGTKSAPVTAAFDVVPAGDPRCDVLAQCTNGEQDDGEEGQDCGGVCPNACTLCPPASACGIDQTCDGEVCVCSAGTFSCGQSCVDPKTDEENCGACGNTCGAGQSCTNGGCCAQGQAMCGGACTDLSSSDEHCGVCGRACSATTRCVDSQCAGCTSDADCNTGESCVASICALTHCENGVRDQTLGEVGVDCGGACPACDSCVTDDDCDVGEACIGNLCKPQTSGCTSSLDCGQGEECDASGACVPVRGCTSDAQCEEEGFVCALGDCVPDNACDPPCADDETCSYGSCIARPDPECTTNDDCPGDQTCRSGQCIGKSQPPSPGEDESHLLAILLIAIGVAIMGGAGYYLYSHDQEKRKAAQAQRTLAAQAMPTTRAHMAARQIPAASGAMTPALAQAYASNPDRQAQLAQEHERREAERAKRGSLFQAFGETPGAPSGASSASPAAPSQAKDAGIVSSESASKTARSAPSATQTRDANDESDEFVDLAAIGKRKTDGKSATTRPAPTPSQERPDEKGKKKDPSAFDELDRL